MNVEDYDTLGGGAYGRRPNNSRESVTVEEALKLAPELRQRLNDSDAGTHHTCQAYVIADQAIAALVCLADELTEVRAAHQKTENELRREWWLNHGHDFSSLYGDDGEMQCKCADFKRAPIEELRVVVMEGRLARAALAAVSDTKPGKPPKFIRCGGDADA